MARRQAPSNRPGSLTNVPAQRDPLIGRERELAAVRQLVLREDVGLVTLTGPGGTGKTRMALRVASDLLDAFPGGVYVVSLAPVRNPELVASTIAHTLGIKEGGGRPLSTSLRLYLRDRQLLLLLDNFEQVLASAPLLTELLAACPGLTVLTTSRAALRVSGEHEFPVPPLALPDLRHGLDLDQETLSECAAVALFLRRARAARPDFTLSRANAATVAEICIRLDGLPLALELAAARLKLLTPPALLARLSSPLTLLTGGARDLPERQQTLRATLAWSYDLLTAEEQRLFRRLAPFVGGFGLTAAEVVGGEPVTLAEPGDAAASLVDRLTSLLDKSLLRQVASFDDQPRFAMLETIREYAREGLEASGEAEDIRRRHALHYLAQVEAAEPSLFGGESAPWLARLEEEHDNLRAALRGALAAGETELALRLAGGLAWFWYDHGHLTEGRRWLAAALAGAEGAPPAARAKALIGAGGLAHRQYDLRAAWEQLEAGLHLSREIGDRWSCGMALVNLGLVAHDQDDYDRARRLHEQSLAVFREVGDSWGIGVSLSNLAWAALFAGDLSQARTVAEEALVLRRDLGDALGVAYTLYTLGRVALTEGNPIRARALLAESVALLQGLGERWGLAVCLEAFALESAAPAGGQEGARRAARLWGAAEALREMLGAPLTAADRRVHERHQAAARTRLGSELWSATWAAGRALPLDEALAEAVADPAPATPVTSAQAYPAGLSAREVEVLRLVAEGLSNAEVAARLSLSPRTIGQHLRSIYNKLGVGSRTAAARFAVERRIV